MENPGNKIMKISQLEIEVKFLTNDIKDIRNRIIATGAESYGEVFEINHRYDDIKSRLTGQKKLLRLRKTDKSTLTFKKSPEISNPDFKIQEEIEVEVSDFEKMERIINELGFFRLQTYEKYRETFDLKGTKILLDLMPFGSFMEIEGSMDSIRSLTDVIGLDWDQRITLNYIQIFSNLSKRLGLEFRDITFEMFEPIKDTFAIMPSDLGL